MIQTVPDILARIVAAKRIELAEAKVPISALEKQVAARPERRDFAAALRAPAIIAEVKQASPSKGVFTADFRPADIAAGYEAGGAAALSVLTDEQFFKGSLDHLVSARARVRIPVLRKDFTIDPRHVWEAAAHGADAILLIAAILTEREMREYRELAEQLGMAALVEVHEREELAPALASGARIVGVNNRNLHSFHVSLNTSLELAAEIPETVIKVSESGIRSKEDIDLLRGAGFQAFLIGEHLMRSGNTREALRSLLA